MDKQTTLTALSHIRRIGNLMNEFMDLSQQIGQALDRNDIVAVKMLMSMRRETAHGMKTARRSLQREIRTVPDRKERERICGSETHLRQVVEALLDNAQKYGTPQSEVIVALKSLNSKQAMLSVSSYGETIRGGDLQKLFDRFYQTQAARTKGQGCGLGLSISERIVSAHDGKIWAESTSGINTFFVQLPVAAIEKPYRKLKREHGM